MAHRMLGALQAGNIARLKLHRLLEFAIQEYGVLVSGA